jgi:hypothetical protein
MEPFDHGIETCSTGVGALCVAGRQNADPWSLGSLLRKRAERPSDRRTANKTDKFPPPHVHLKIKDKASYRLNRALRKGLDVI